MYYVHGGKVLTGNRNFVGGSSPVKIFTGGKSLFKGPSFTILGNDVAVIEGVV